MPMLNNEYYTLDIQALYSATMEELEELDAYYQSLKVSHKHAHALNQDEHDLIQTCIDKRRKAAQLKEKSLSEQNDLEPS